MGKPQAMENRLTPVPGRAGCSIEKTICSHQAERRTCFTPDAVVIYSILNCDRPDVNPTVVKINHAQSIGWLL
jgi:hypothetical protein